MGVAELVDCRPVRRDDWKSAGLPPLEGRLWAWVLAEPQAVGPLPCPGKRTLFDLDQEVPVAN